MKKRHLIIIYCFILVSIFPIRNVKAQWEPANGSWLYATNCLTFKDTLMFAGTWDKLFISNNKGYGWKLLKNMPMNDMVIIGSRIFGGNNSGLFCSSDNGNNWQLADSNFKNLRTFCTELHDDYVYAGTYGRGVWRSSDYGNTWAEKNNGLKNIHVSSIAFLDDAIIAGTNGGIYVSKDKGDTWNVIYDHPSIISVVTCGENILAQIWNKKNIISTDRGTTWSEIDLQGALFSNGSTVFISQTPNDLYRSIDKGLTWTKSNSGSRTIVPLTYHVGSFYGVRGDIETLGSSDEIVISKENGASWMPIYGYLHPGFNDNRSTTKIVSNEDDLLAITQEGKYLHYSSDNGNNWRRIVIPGDTIFSVLPQEKLIFLSTEKGMFSSNDQGLTWKYLHPSAKNIYFKNSVLYGYNNNSISISFDLGQNWMTHPLPWNDNSIPSLKTKSLVLHNNHLFLGGTLNEPSAKFLFRSSDNGATWTDVSAGLKFDPMLSWYEISIDNLISKEGYIFAISRWHIFRSSDLGNTWTNLEHNYESQYETIVPLEEVIQNGDSLYCVNYYGIFYSKNNGDNWKFIKLERSSDICSNNRYLFIVTDKGVQRYSLSGLTSLSEPGKKSVLKTFYLSQNYPNPFNPTTTIRYQIPESEFISIKVYDLLGKEVATLVNEQKPAGEYVTEFNASNLSSGIYLYRLQAESFIETMKLLLMK